MRKSFKIGIAAGLIALTLSSTGCMREYDTPEFVEVSPSQSVVVIPLVGKTSEQGKGLSTEFYKNHLVYAKRIQIPHTWLQTGRMSVDGKYVDTVRVIKTERKPAVREWTDTNDTGTSTKNQAFIAESNESIGFKARLTASAQIEEPDVPTFLYHYNGKPLEEIMDQDIRNYAAGQFTELCAKQSIDNILIHKGEIMDAVRKSTIDTFEDRGITITALNLTGEFTYLNPAVQTSIDSVFEAGRKQQAQNMINKATRSEAQAKAYAGRIMNSANSIKLKQIELEQARIANTTAWIQAWKETGGKVPSYLGTSNTMFTLPK